MNKKLLGIVVIVLVVAGSFFYYSRTEVNDSDEALNKELESLNVNDLESEFQAIDSGINTL